MGGEAGMIRIAMLGCDSSHTEAYAELLHKAGSKFYGRARIEWLWGEDMGQATAKAAAVGIANVLTSLDDDRMKEADFIMVNGRYGDSHFIPARKAIESGKPVYVDKPFTNNYSEAVALKELAEENKVLLRSFSPLRYATEIVQAKKRIVSAGKIYAAVVSGPANTNAIEHPKAKKLHFYAVHAADILVSVFGTGVRTIRAKRTSDGIWVDLSYNDRNAVLNLPLDVKEFYHLALFGTGNVIACSADPYGDFYERTMEVLLNEMLLAPGNNTEIEEACESILILDSIERSLTENKEIILS